jgi:DNA-directed RNA polymerase subunit K/omega
MAIKKVQPTTVLAEKLEEWSRLRGVEGDPYLSQLTESLKERKNLHVWAELQPLDFLPYPKSESQNRQSDLVRILTIIRNVLVFAPVALTWAAVSAATTGFAAYTKENGASVVNFLDFWQNGYGYLSDKWKIGEVARLDFILVMIVIVLTLFVSIVGHRAQQMRSNEEALIDQERSTIALEIAQVLHDKRKITTVTMNQALAGSISRLVNATHNLESATKEINKAQKNQRA